MAQVTTALNPDSCFTTGEAWDHYYTGNGHSVYVDAANYMAHSRRAKTFLRLIAGLRKWTETRNARHILIHPTGRDLAATDKLLRAAGMECVGGADVG